VKDPLDRIRPVPDYTFRTGTVHSTAGARVNVTIVGADIAVGRLKSYTPSVGDIVVVLFYNGDGVILGAIA
jgi:hypothetical protein